jgi:hypothetical protein
MCGSRSSINFTTHPGGIVNRSELLAGDQRIRHEEIMAPRRRKLRIIGIFFGTVGVLLSLAIILGVGAVLFPPT